MQRLVWRLFLGLDVCLLVLFVVAYMARYVSPHHVWWLQLVAVALPALSALVVVMGGLAGLLGKGWLLAFHIVCMMLALARFWPVTSSSSVGTSPNAALQVLTYNVKLKEGRASEEAFIALLRVRRPNVIALQESKIAYVDEPPRVLLAPQTRFVMEAGRYETYHYPGSAHRAGTSEPIFVGMAGKEPTYTYWAVGDGASRRQAVTRAQVEWEGQEIAIYNVHLRSFNPEGESKASLFDLGDVTRWPAIWRSYRDDVSIRAEEARQLRELLDREELPFIVCGDFNSTPHNWVYAHVSRGLQDAFAAAGRGLGGTYHARLPLVRIDYVLASPEWRVHSAEVVKTSISDHRPVVAELVLR